MVSNDIASGPGLARCVLHFGGHLGFADARPNRFQRAIEKAGAQSTADRRHAISSSSFTMRACSTMRRGLSQTDARGQNCGQARPGSHRHVLALNPNLRGSSTAFLLVRREPGGGCRERAPGARSRSAPMLTSARACPVYRPSVMNTLFFPVRRRTPALPVNPQR